MDLPASGPAGSACGGDWTRSQSFNGLNINITCSFSEKKRLKVKREKQIRRPKLSGNLEIQYERTTSSEEI